MHACIVLGCIVHFCTVPGSFAARAGLPIMQYYSTLMMTHMYSSSVSVWQRDAAVLATS